MSERRAPPDWIKSRAAAQGGRIDLADTPANAVLKLVESDRAAAEACIAMVKAVASAEPEAIFGPFTPLVILDAIGLRGAAIGEFYTRVCGADPVTALALLHAVRLKLITPATLKRATAGRETIDAAALIGLVRHKTPGFGTRRMPER